MTLVETIQKLIPSLKPDQVDAIAAILSLAGFDELEDTDETPGAPETPTPVSDPGEGVAPLRNVDINKVADALKTLGFKPGEPAAVGRPAYEFKPVGVKEPDPEKEAKEKATKSFEAAYLTRFGEEDSAKKAVMTDLVGDDYRDFIWRQNQAFTKYLRFGDVNLDSNDRKALQTQIFPVDGIIRMISDGMSVAEVKTTMVEAQGTLGGYAVPPNVQSNIVTRMPGLTAIRGNGATIITLANANSVELPLYSGGDKRYIGALRGAWGTEAIGPVDKNATLAMEAVQANLYSYKVPMSQSLLEDATNLVALVQNDIATVLSIDEDEAFLIGDGIGKPLGILPASGNSLGLTEAKSGDANKVTPAGIKALKRGVLSQYRKNAIWIANSTTFGLIEALQATTGQFIFDDLSEKEQLLNKKVAESEALPDVAANAYPILFLDPSAYYIVERLGLTIVRFQDSGTDVNKVEFHVRRRIGGRLIEPWKAAVQKITA